MALLLAGSCLGLKLSAQETHVPPAAATASESKLRGTVTDADGSAVVGARVILNLAVNGAREAQTDAQGSFTFSSVPAGVFKLVVNAEGFSPALREGRLDPAAAGSDTILQVPAISLRAASSTEVQVTSSADEVLKAEVKVEETQRLFGAIPNFFVAYDWKAPPLKARQKFELSYKATIDPVTVMINEITAGAQEATNTLPGYGKGGNGFVKRFAANEADTAIGTFTGGYLFPILFRQDPRYFYMGPSRTKTRRFFYALSTAFICRGDNGKWQPNYSSVLGDLASGAAANAYYPKSNRNAWGLVLEGGLLGAALDGVGNVVQEFLYKKITPKAPNYPASN